MTSWWLSGYHLCQQFWVERNAEMKNLMMTKKAWLARAHGHIDKPPFSIALNLTKVNGEIKWHVLQISESNCGVEGKPLCLAISSELLTDDKWHSCGAAWRPTKHQFSLGTCHDLALSSASRVCHMKIYSATSRPSGTFSDQRHLWVCAELTMLHDCAKLWGPIMAELETEAKINCACQKNN